MKSALKQSSGDETKEAESRLNTYALIFTNHKQIKFIGNKTLEQYYLITYMRQHD